MLSRLRSLWRNLVHRETVDHELEEELRGTFEALEEEHRRTGMTDQEARRAAMIQLGRVESLKEQIRDVKAGAFLDGFLQDSRYGVRVLRRNPVFTLTAALSLAIGIGATTTIFTVANALLLRVAPGVAEPGRLVDIVPAMKGHFGLIMNPHADYLAIRERVVTLEDVYAYQLE